MFLYVVFDRSTGNEKAPGLRGWANTDMCAFALHEEEERAQVRVHVVKDPRRERRRNQRFQCGFRGVTTR